jgi:hypothetical protein
MATQCLSNLARSSTVLQLFRLSNGLPNGLMKMAVSDSTNISRRLLDATPCTTEKRKRFCRLAGLRCPTILCEFFILFEDFYFFRRITDHSLVGLQNGAMLLLGGSDWGTIGDRGYGQTGIWQLKAEEWSRIGEFSKV